MFKLIGKVAAVFRKVSGWVMGRSPPPASAPPSVRKEFSEWTEAIRPQWINVISSYVRAVRYDPSTQKLEVNYLGKKICTYSNISPDTCANMLLAPSKGRWVRTHLFSLPYS